MEKSSSKSVNGERNSQAFEQIRLHMERAGFVPGSRVAYLRALNSRRCAGLPVTSPS
jgi:hypothetical protein